MKEEHDQILDAPTPKSDKFAQASFRYFVINIILLLVSSFGNILVNRQILKGEVFEISFALTIVGMFVCSCLGVAKSVRSFREREPGNAKKIIGLIGNLFFLVLFLSLIGMNIMDFNRQFGAQ
ncbi:MAG: hypothetical protein AAF502_16630 [Bacteroidota bacterium]